MRSFTQCHPIFVRWTSRYSVWWRVLSSKIRPKITQKSGHGRFTWVGTTLWVSNPWSPTLLQLFYHVESRRCTIEAFREWRTHDRKRSLELVSKFYLKTRLTFSSNPNQNRISQADINFLKHPSTREDIQMHKSVSSAPAYSSASFSIFNQRMHYSSEKRRLSALTILHGSLLRKYS